jgi:hypothetical protein
MQMHRVTLDWKSKLHPAFVEMTDAYSKSMLELEAILEEAHRAEEVAGSNISPREKSQIAARVVSRRDELMSQFDKKIKEIDDRHKPLDPSPLCYPYLSLTDLPKEVSSKERDAQTLFEWIHWERHHESANKDAEADGQGDLDAFERLSRTGKDWRIITFNKGPIKPFQGGIYHQDIFQIGLSFASGMEKLTAEELADVFDTYCPCGTEIHDSRALRKQCLRLVKDLEKAVPSKT